MPITVTHAKSNVIADYTGTVTVANSSGGTQTMEATNLVRPVDWNSAHAVTLQMSASEIASLFNFGAGLSTSSNSTGISVNAAGMGFRYEPFSLLNTNSTMVAFPAGTWYVEPVDFRYGLSSGHFRLLLTYNSANFSYGVVGWAANTGQATKSARFRNCLAIYGHGTGANATRIESLWTGECAISATQSITFSSTATSAVFVTNNITYGFIDAVDASGGSTSTTVTTGGTASVGASTMASTVPNSLITGGAVMDWFTGSVLHLIPFNTTLPPGIYYLAHMHTIDSTGGTTGGGNYLAGTCFNSSPGRMCILDPVLTAFKQLGNSTAATSTTMAIPFKGHLVNTSSQASANIAPSALRATTGRLYFDFVNLATS